MPVEIERKFLVVSDDWRRNAARHVHIRDGLIAIAGNRKVRVRIADDAATLAVKSRVARGKNFEFEYPVPLADAEYMLAHECDGNLLGKTRYFVPFGGLTWEVDVYEDPLGGSSSRRSNCRTRRRSSTCRIGPGKKSPAARSGRRSTC